MRSALRTAVQDPSLSAVVVRQTPLYYGDGADPALDRPAHIRAGSSLARVPGGIALVQDDANFLALVDPDTAHARAIPLPAGTGGLRLFDTGRGNKADKLDLEACVAASVDGETLLLAFGSGSTARREGIVLAGNWGATEPTVELVQAHAFYARLRDEVAFAGEALNLEGAVLFDDQLLLLTRGNGRARDDYIPVAATCAVDFRALLAYLRDPDRHAPPEPTDVIRYQLGSLNGTRLGFTDAARWGDDLLFTAAAEGSVDEVEDGEVAGSVIGIIGSDGDTRWTSLVGDDGGAFTGKVEGLLAPHDEAGHLHAVLDTDDWNTPSVLCTVRLGGTWQRNSGATR
jgi:hypothetical protein